MAVNITHYTDSIIYTIPASKTRDAHYLPRKARGIILSFTSAAMKIGVEKISRFRHNMRDIYGENPSYVEVDVMEGKCWYEKAEFTKLVLPFSHDDFHTLVLAARREGRDLDVSTPEKISELREHPSLHKPLTIYRG